MQTWKDYELAAAERFQDGFVVAAHRAPGAAGAVYLFGYTVEMLLKAAFFRNHGLGPADPAWAHRKQLLAAANRAVPPPPAPYGPDYHSLPMLRDALIALRNMLGRPIGSLESALRHHVGRLASHWSVEMRYSAAPRSESAVLEAFEAADWMLKHYPLL